jgi:hypothetical protein
VVTGLPWLRVAGQRIVTQAGEPVLLRGAGVGGWLNMENFITGYPSTESLQREAMRAAMGEGAYQAFFRRFTECFFGDADARYLASLGANCVRLPVNYRLLGSPYVQQIAAVLAKKRRLGTDSWGGDDRQVRYLLEPIEQLFAKEFAGFDPYPWGARPWIARIVREILLAEPLVQEFGRCFAGLSAAAAAGLADSFAFAACDRNEQLAALLREFLSERRAD